MVVIETLRRLMEVADARRDPYALAEVAGELLEMDPGDARAAGHYARALVALELGAVARDWLAATGEPWAAEMQASAAKVPGGVVPWSSRRRRFQANLRALEQRGMATAEILAAWENAQEKPAERYELHQSADGNFHVVDRSAAPASTAGGVGGARSPLWRAWLSGLQDFKAATGGVTIESFRGQLREPMVFDGMGHGWLIPRLLEVTESAFLNYSAPAYVVEPDLVALCIVLHMHDFQAWFAGPRFRLFAGADAAERFERTLRERPDWTLPAHVVVDPLRPRKPLGLEPRIKAVAAHRAEVRRQTLERITAHYAGFDNAAWRVRYAEALAGKGPPLRVLGITTRYSTVLRYSMEEWRVAAGSCGLPLQMEVCMEPDDQSLEKDLMGMIDRLKPDLLVSISRMRYEMPDLPRNVPALCWDQDNLQCMRDPGALADMRGLSFVAGHGAVFGSMHLQWPLGACIFCHPAGMTHRYQPGAASADEMARFGGDVSYVSHASGLPEEFRKSLRIKWEGVPDFLPLFDATSSEVIGVAGTGVTLEFLELQDIMLRVAQAQEISTPAAVTNALIADLRLLIDRVFRHTTLEWVARWCESRGRRLRIWGNGWTGHPTLGKWAAGSALPGDEAQAVYRCSRINLQIIETGILHSRLLDGWAAGGFFLIRQAHRTQDERRIANCHRIGMLAASESILTVGDLMSRGSRELQSAWECIAAEYAAFDRNRAFSGFRMWRSLVPAQKLLKGLDRVIFNDAAGFEERAELFCNSDAARAQTVAEVREVLESQLSYDARWRDFIGHVAANLDYAR